MIENILGSEIHPRISTYDVWRAECYHKVNCEPISDVKNIDTYVMRSMKSNLKSAKLILLESEKTEFQSKRTFLGFCRNRKKYHSRIYPQIIRVGYLTISKFTFANLRSLFMDRVTYRYVR